MRGILRAILILLLLQFSFSVYAQQNYNTLIHEGNAAFSRNNYERAAASFSKAAKANGKGFEAHYNLGNSFYRQKKYAEARAEFEKAQALASNKADKMAALYNLGNVEMQSNNHEKAAARYKEALKWNPYYENARRNYQISKLRQKEKQNGGGGNGGGKNGKDPKQQQDKAGQNQQAGGKGGQQKGRGSEGNNPDPSNNKNNAGNMPNELQDELMRRIEGKERETARKILNKNSYSMPQSNEKDW